MSVSEWTLLIVTAVVALGLLGLDRRAERKQREADAEAYRRVLAKQDLARDAQITTLRDWQQPTLSEKATKGISDRSRRHTVLGHTEKKEAS